jgi:hypothetical protein
MFAQNVLSSHLYGHTVVKVFDLSAHPSVCAGFGRTGRTRRMEASRRYAANSGRREAGIIPCPITSEDGGFRKEYLV